VDTQTLSKRIHENAAAKGFWDAPNFWDQIGNKLALVHSEVTELLEALRKGQGTAKTADEFADIFIRLLDLWHVLQEHGYVEGDLDLAIINKVEVNEGREPLHGNVFG